MVAWAAAAAELLLLSSLAAVVMEMWNANGRKTLSFQSGAIEGIRFHGIFECIKKRERGKKRGDFFKTRKCLWTVQADHRRCAALVFPPFMNMIARLET